MDCSVPLSGTRPNEHGLNQSELHRMLQFFTEHSAAPRPPQKVILWNPGLVEVFRKSYAFGKILFYTEACAESIRGIKYRDRRSLRPLNPTVKYIVDIFFPALHELIDRIPLAEVSQQRFGNQAKRLFHDALERELPSHMEKLVATLPPLTVGIPNGNTNADVSAAAASAAAALSGAVQPYRLAKRKVSSVTLSSGEEIRKVVGSINSSGAVVRGSSSSTSLLSLPGGSATVGTDPYPANSPTQDTSSALFPTVLQSRARTTEEASTLAAELAEYLKDSFGNARRLDYGSGHELHFFLFLIICLEEHRDLGGLIDGSHSLARAVHLEVPTPPDVPEALADEVYCRRQEFMFFAFRDYLSLMRRIQTHYNLEPAGSHGVWGLDDYHHLPYVLGAAQLTCYDSVPGCAPRGPVDPDAVGLSEEPQPSHRTQRNSRSGSIGTGVKRVFLPEDVCDKEKVAAFHEDFFYPSMIQWIYTHKKGPFHEHSNMLFNISSVATWEKTFSGMLKMFAAEVLAKFNVSQHLLFGEHLPWNTKTMEEQPTLHSTQMEDLTAI